MKKPLTEEWESFDPNERQGIMWEEWTEGPIDENYVPSHKPTPEEKEKNRKIVEQISKFCIKHMK
jgi:hypothetical protein